MSRREKRIPSRLKKTPPSDGTRAVPGWKARLLYAAVVSAAFAFTLCLFGPLDLFFNNCEELWFHLGDILGGVVLTALLFFAGTTLAGALLPGKLHSIYMALLFGGLLGTYVQGSFMNRNYGILNGTEVDWSAYTGYGVFNALVWAVCIALPLLALLIWKERRVRPALMFLSCALILMQGASLAVSWVNYPGAEHSTVLSRDGIYTLSKEENTVVFLLDTVDEQYFRKFLQEKPQHKQTLDGFTCYDNTLAAGARTQVALPLLLSGLPRTEPGTYNDYIDYIWEHQTLFEDLNKAGYDTRLYTEPYFVSPATVGKVANVETAASSVSNHFGLVKKFYKLTLYKYAPHFMKPRFWLYTGDFDKFKKNTQYDLDDEKFYRGFLKAEGFTCTRKEKCFRLYHMMGIHKPYRLTSSGTKRKDRAITSRRRQMNGIFQIVEDMMADMKKNGVYDKSNIFIIADHGDKGKFQWAMCLYKPAGATGELKTSDAPVSLLDVTTTLDALAGGDSSKVGAGRTLTEVKEKEARARNYYLNVGSNATFITGEFETTGHASDSEALKLVHEYDVTDPADIPDYRLGTELSFAGDKATANVYCTHGFRTATNATTHMEGRTGQMVIPIADPPGDGELEVKLELSSVKNATPMEIRVGDKTVLSLDLKDPLPKKDKVQTFRVPVSALEDGKLTLDFTFSGIPAGEEDKPAGTRLRSVKLKGITVRAV